MTRRGWRCRYPQPLADFGCLDPSYSLNSFPNILLVNLCLFNLQVLSDYESYASRQRFREGKAETGRAGQHLSALLIQLTLEGSRRDSELVLNHDRWLVSPSRHFRRFRRRFKASPIRERHLSRSGGIDGDRPSCLELRRLHKQLSSSGHHGSVRSTSTEQSQKA